MGPESLHNGIGAWLPAENRELSTMRDNVLRHKAESHLLNPYEPPLEFQRLATDPQMDQARRGRRESNGG